MHRRAFIPKCIAVVAALACSTINRQPALAQQPAWPTKEVRIVVPFAPGTAPDVMLRTVAEKLKVTWGKGVIVENTPGASGTIGVGKVSKATPDGYTLVMSGDAAVVVAPSLFKALPYDPVKDLAPIIRVGRTPNILVVNAEKGPRSLKELIELARTRPELVTFNSAGYGTSQNIGIELLQQAAGIKVLHAPKSGPTLPEILGGQVMATFGNVTIFLPHVKQGTLRALGVSGMQRLAVAPEIPTIAEQGYPGFDAVAWFGLLAPAGTPPDIVTKINADVARALAEPEVGGKLTELGVQLDDKHAPDVFARLIKAEIPRIAEVLKNSGIKID